MRKCFQGAEKFTKNSKNIHKTYPLYSFSVHNRPPVRVGIIHKKLRKKYLMFVQIIFEKSLDRSVVVCYNKGTTERKRERDRVRHDRRQARATERLCHDRKI